MGCGLVGWKIIKGLEEHEELDLVVVDRKEYFENTTGALRCAVDSLYHNRTSMQHFAWLKEPERLIVGQLAEISPKLVRPLEHMLSIQLVFALRAYLLLWTDSRRNSR